VVGSKGKGSTVAALSTLLTTAGFRVGAVTSPAYLSNRERIRIQGVPVSRASYKQLSARLESVLSQLPATEHGYLSPSGAFLGAGSLLFLEKKLDVVILEEGIGGRSDDISYFDFDVVVLTRVFLEHAGRLGNTNAQIARDLLGVVGRKTKSLISPPQDHAVEQVIRKIQRSTGISRSKPAHGVPIAITPLPPVLQANSELAHAAFAEVSLLLGAPARNPEPLKLNLPGRYTVFRGPGTDGHSWLIDAANHPDSLAQTLDYAFSIGIKVKYAFVCFSNLRSRQAGFALLSHAEIWEVVIQNPQNGICVDERLAISLEEALAIARRSSADCLFVGNIWFVSNVLRALKIDVGAW
jgi:dihydrofolate synthase/folylpolyglutamate synthase